MNSSTECIVRARELFRQIREAGSQGLLTQFPNLLAPTRNICDAVGRLDIGHLHWVPILTLDALTRVLSDAVGLINKVNCKSYPAGQSVKLDVFPALSLERNAENIASWQRQLELHDATLFQLVGGIVAQQQVRRAWIAAPPARLEASPTLKERGSDTYWRYMPLRNLLRCESASGIWMSSLQLLRIWSRPGIPDIREGDVHPKLEDLDSRIAFAAAGGADAWERIQLELGITAGDAKELLRTDGMRFDLETTFVSSWARRKNESSPMWSAYGDGGDGIAIKSNRSMLEGCQWRAPLDLCGYIGGNRMKGLALREVCYLDFDDADQLPSDVRAWFPPLLKRSQFEDEHETRIIAFTDSKVASMGFTLHCNLTDIVSEIVVGPHADFAQTESQIRSLAPDLERVPVTRSKLGSG